MENFTSFGYSSENCCDPCKCFVCELYIHFLYDHLTLLYVVIIGKVHFNNMMSLNSKQINRQK